MFLGWGGRGDVTPGTREEEGVELSGVDLTLLLRVS